MLSREATLDDIPQIVALTRRVHGETEYRDAPLDVPKYMSNLRTLMASKQHLVLVCDGDDELAGFFLGICEPHFVLKGKYATDLTFHALPAYPGVGVAMARRFLSWARARRDVALIIMGISNDMVDEQRLGRFYERQGLKRMGGLYLQITGVTL